MRFFYVLLEFVKLNFIFWGIVICRERNKNPNTSRNVIIIWKLKLGLIMVMCCWVCSCLCILFYHPNASQNWKTKAQNQETKSKRKNMSLPSHYQPKFSLSHNSTFTHIYSKIQISLSMQNLALRKYCLIHFVLFLWFDCFN